MNTLILNPTDVLFFRDGRPIGGSLAGHGAAWPMPNVLNQALHAALWRSSLGKEAHTHRHHSERTDVRNRKFGSLISAGPFPVHIDGKSSTWYFPRPADAQIPHKTRPSVLPLGEEPGNHSSLPAEIRYPAANTEEPSKEKPDSWWSEEAWSRYLQSPENEEDATKKWMKSDSDFAATEYAIGIGIDAATGTQDKERFYSAQYLRLREEWRLGVLASACDKGNGHANGKNDLLVQLFTDSEHILVGGQQRICTAKRETAPRIPLPIGQAADFRDEKSGKYLVKWILLTPAIWPEIEASASKRRKTSADSTAHPGGWLPNWIEAATRETEGGRVLLRIVSEDERKRRRRMNYGGEGYRSDEDAPSIGARLVAAIVQKPLVVTGYAGGAPDAGGLNEADFEHPRGAKSVHLAVPAGAVYYFEADSKEDAEHLATALNWNGASPQPTTIKNRRSTLMGEKGFGLGVCGAWTFHSGDVPGHPQP